MINRTALLKHDNVILDLDYLENLADQKQDPDKTTAELVNLEDYLVEQEPKKVPFTTEEAIWLEDALFLQTYKSDSKEVKALTSKIFQEIKTNHKQRINEPDKTQKMLEIIVINLWIGYFYNQPLMFSARKEEYNTPKRYKKSYLTYDRLQIIVRNMEELGYIEIKKGYFYSKDDNRNRISRMWATPKLFKNFFSHTDSEIPDFYEPDKPVDIIILRDKNNEKDIDYTDNKITRKMREQLQNHNEFIDQHTITMELDGEVEISNSFLVETLYKNLIKRKIKIKKIVTEKNITRLPVKIPHREQLMEDLLKLEFVQDNCAIHTINPDSDDWNCALHTNPKDHDTNQEDLFVKKSKGANGTLAHIKRDAPEGTINNPLGIGGKSGKQVDIDKCYNITINKEDQLPRGTCKDKNNYSNGIIVSEGFKDQGDNITLKSRCYIVTSKDRDTNTPYLITHTELDMDNQVDNVNLKKANDNISSFCPSGGQPYNVILSKESGKVDIDKPYNVRINNNMYENNQHKKVEIDIYANDTIIKTGHRNKTNHDNVRISSKEYGNKAVRIPYHKQSLMNFLKKSQKNMATPAFQTDNYPTNTRILYQNTNTRLTLPHQLKNPTYELPNNITNILSYPTHTYKYITDRSPYHHIYSISDATHKYNPSSSITGPNICNPLILHDFNSKLLSEKLLLKMLKTCNRISGFLRNLDKKNKPKKKKKSDKKNKPKKKKSDKKKYTEKQQKNFQSKKCENNKKFLGLKFKLKDIGIQYLELELSYTHAHRVFGRGNKRFKYNGRFYGPVYQSIPGDLRKYIKINGEPAVELDFSALHIRMLYHQHDIDYQDDPYEACGVHSLRKTFKQAFLIVINSESEEIAKKSLLKKMYEKNLPWPGQKNPINYIMDTIKKEHKSICDCICNDKGVDLMREDSKIMNNILMSLMEKGICGLSVHDSVIVAERHRDTLFQVMREEYKKIMDFYPVID